MLEVTMSYGDIKLNKAELHADEAFEIFKNIPLPSGEMISFPNEHTAIFEHHPKRITMNRGQGIKEPPAGYILDPRIDGILNGRPVKIRLYTSKETNDKGATVYKPDNINFLGGGGDSISLDRDRELAVFLALHQRCEDSPIKPKKGAKWWRLKNQVKENKKRKDQIMDRKKAHDLIDKIYKLDPQKLLAIARGIEGVRVNKQSLPDDVYAEMYDYADKDPGKFLREVDSPQIYAQGFIKNALATGALKQRPAAGGAMELFFDDGSVFVRVPEKHDISKFAGDFYLENADRFLHRFGLTEEQVEIEKENLNPVVPVSEEEPVKKGAFGRPIKQT